MIFPALVKTSTYITSRASFFLNLKLVFLSGLLIDSPENSTFSQTIIHVVSFKNDNHRTPRTFNLQVTGVRSYLHPIVLRLKS